MKGSVFAPAQLPPHMPHLRDGWHRKLCRGVLRLCGWSLVGAFPDVPKLVLIAAPHSSWWDGIWGLLMKAAIGADVHFMAKRELFRGPLGGLLVKLGGIPIDRGAAAGMVEQMIDRFGRPSTLWLGIAPEGTRRHVSQWKTGFWRIAHGAGVPVFPVAFNYPDKTIRLGPLFATTDDMAADIERLRAFYAPFKGKHHGV
jgi:1-acyl-sn-glycerol-3-phosphate acyltransferase